MSPPPPQFSSGRGLAANLPQEHHMSQDMTSSYMASEMADFDNTFEVCIKRNSLGLGFSICGGTEAPAPWTNLIRIKKIFPLQPAWQTGQLQVGDVLLKVSGVSLTGLSLRQALDILRTSPPLTKLLVCRIPDPVSTTNQDFSHNSSKQHRSSVVRSYSYGPCNINQWPSLSAQQELKSFANLSLNGGESTNNCLGLNSAGESMEIDISPSTPEKEWSPPPPTSGRGRGGGGDNNRLLVPGVNSFHHDNEEEEATSTLDLLKPIEDTLRSQHKIIGEFSVTLTKVKGSLGFSLLSTDDTVLNHSIKAILRDPALSDGRIQAGDKLVSANGVDLSTFSHQDLIAFLRKCDETVTLGLFRDASRSGTPLDPESPPLPKSRDGSLTRKHLRYEAKELVRSLQSSRTSLEKAGLGSQPGSYSANAAAHGTLGRRRARQFSPAAPNRLQHNYYGGSSSGGSGVLHPQPTVESPSGCSPLNSSAPPSLGMGMIPSAVGGVTPVSRRQYGGGGEMMGTASTAVAVENNNCDEVVGGDKLCIEEIDSGSTEMLGGGGSEGGGDYMVCTPGTPAAGGGGGFPAPAGGVVMDSATLPTMFVSSPPLDNSTNNLIFHSARGDDANRNSVPRTLGSSSSSSRGVMGPSPSSSHHPFNHPHMPPFYSGRGGGDEGSMFLTCEQSRSLPHGMPLFPTQTVPEKPESFTRPTELNLNKDAKKRRGFYFSPARF